LRSIETGHEFKSKVAWRKLRDVPGTFWFRFCDGAQTAQNAGFRHNVSSAWMTPTIRSVPSFGISMVAICWAWMNYSWFASAYDADDVTFSVPTMIHMVGMIVFALGLPWLFQSVAERVRLDNTVMVLGYVIMRMAMIFLWIRAAKYDRNRRRTSANAGVAFIAQILWTWLIHDCNVGVPTP
jgi:Bacterial low temperature requirement A protein (LtrA)